MNFDKNELRAWLLIIACLLTTAGLILVNSVNAVPAHRTISSIDGSVIYVPASKGSDDASLARIGFLILIPSIVLFIIYFSKKLWK
jgi:hypothetical protein